MSIKSNRPTQRARTPLSEIILRPIRFFKIFCFSLGLSVLIASMCLIGYVIAFLRAMPDLQHLSFEDLQHFAQRRVAERCADSKSLGRWVPLSGVSRDFIYSIVMSEDSTFFEHDGLNLDAIANSVAEDIRIHKAAFGGSTITQQVVKNLFLDSQKSVSRKIKEILITRNLEAHFSKNQILELYLNLAEFGPDLYGVRVAAEHYFHKTPLEINAAEGAFIALMLPSPKRYYYSVVENRNLTQARRKRINRVLRDMLYQEYISEEQYRKYTHFNFFSRMNRTPAWHPLKPSER